MRLTERRINVTAEVNVDVVVLKKINNKKKRKKQTNGVRSRTAEIG
jgi:hypothetical protein